MSPTVYITGGLTVAVAVMYGLWTYQIKQARAERDAAIAMVDVSIGQVNQAKAVNEANLATLKAIQADLSRQQAATIKAEAQSRDRAFALSKALKRISDAPKSEDGPVSGVLLDTVDQLRMVPRSDTPADGNNPGGAATPPGPTGPVVPTPSATPTS